MVNMMNLVPGEWENYADETEHYCYVRCLDLGKMYEAVCVRHINGTDDANYLHQVFFPEEWCEEALVELLQRFEYETWTISFRTSISRIQKKASSAMRTARLTAMPARPGTSTGCTWST